MDKNPTIEFIELNSTSNYNPMSDSTENLIEVSLYQFKIKCTDYNLYKRTLKMHIYKIHITRYIGCFFRVFK